MSEQGGETWAAPAKLNLFLHVTGRREDGYHELQTLFQILDWGDELSIRATNDASIRRVGSDFGVPEDQDLAIRAARLLQDECGGTRGAEISIVKNIPMGSGMGGGSSDAATVLLVLNRLWDCGLGIDRLAELGAALGADVPLFVRGRTAMARGIGEKLQPVRLGRRHYVLVFPGVHIGTPVIFSDAGLSRDSEVISLEEAVAGGGRNDCEAVVLSSFPAMAEAFENLARWGRPKMTGTGSGIFLEVENEALANSTAKAIKNLYNSRAVRGVDVSPVHEKLYTDGL
jgi:4-diphosphocytidyl-2-C-methyl-D-erythritol kinase